MMVELVGILSSSKMVWQEKSRRNDEKDRPEELEFGHLADPLDAPTSLPVTFVLRQSEPRYLRLRDPAPPVVARPA